MSADEFDAPATLCDQRPTGFAGHAGCHWRTGHLGPHSWAGFLA